MGLISRIRGRKTALTNQADKPCAEESTLEEQLIEAEAWLAKVQLLPQSSWKPRFAAGQITNYSVDAKADDIAYAKADVAELKTKLRLTQWLPQAVSQDKPSKNATRKERQNHGE